MARTPRKAIKPAVTPLPSWCACLPPAYEIADVAAMQALERGDANTEQQQRALRWIIEVAGARNDMSYRPGGEEGRRDTDFAEGRRFVANQVVKLLRLNLGILRRLPESVAHEPSE